MSKTCISDLSDPLTFFQLDILANWLIRETYSMQGELLTKFDFLKDRQSQLADNERQIVRIVDLLKQCKLNVNTAEEEIQQLEYDLTFWTKIVDSIEVPPLDKCSCRFLRRTDRDAFFEMIQNTDSKICQLSSFTSEVEAIMNYFGIPRNPYDIIFRILDYQTQILRNTDHNMNLILDKLLIITNMTNNVEQVKSQIMSTNANNQVCPHVSMFSACSACKNIM